MPLPGPALLVLGFALSGAVGWALGRYRKGRPTAGLLWGLFLGPIGWAILFLRYGGAIRCPECGRMTPYLPKISGHPRAHLRCAFCGEIAEW